MFTEIYYVVHIFLSLYQQPLPVQGLVGRLSDSKYCTPQVRVQALTLKFVSVPFGSFCIDSLY